MKKQVPTYEEIEEEIIPDIKNEDGQVDEEQALNALKLVQDDLRGEMQTPGAHQKTKIADKTRQIFKMLASAKPADKSSLKSLKYLISMTSDLTKMLRFI